MITGVHTMFYTSAPQALRTFLRDTIGFSHTDVGDGWLIFDVPDADMGCHPADADDGKPSGTAHISFLCDDIHDTVQDLSRRGVRFIGDITDQGYGLVAHFEMPGDIEVELVEPRYKRSPQ